MSRDHLQPSSTTQDEQQRRQSGDNAATVEGHSASSLGLRQRGPRHLGGQQLLSIQRTLGNQATLRYLRQAGVIQRQETDAPRGDDVEIPELDPEISRMLEGLFSADREAAPTEVITSSTGAELTHEGLSPAIGDMWQRQHIEFAEAAREIADGNTISDRDSISTRSSELDDPEGRAYSQRWGLVVGNSDYPDTEGDLPEVHAALQAGSPFASALTGSFDQQRIFEDLSAADTLSRIRLVINELMLALHGRETAELVIYLSGHGSNGDFIGVDNQHVMIDDLRQLGEMARDYGIHPIFIIDACTAGSAVQTLQERGVTYLRGRIELLPPDQREIAQQQLSAVSDLAMWMDAVSYTAATIRNIVHFDPLSPDVDPLGTEAPERGEGNYFQNLQYQLFELRDLLNSGRLDVLAEPTMVQFRTHFDEALAWIQDVVALLEMPTTADRRFPLRRIARLLDDANTVMNNVLQRIDQQIHAIP